jgi:predicted acyl esterase
MSQAPSVKEKVELAVPDGTRMAAYVARPEQGGPHPVCRCDERASHEPRSARQAWALTLEFLRS